jgi:hypothetical protein
VQPPLRDVARRAHLHDAAEVHDRDAVAHVPDDAQVVRDEQVAHRELVLQSLEQVQDLRLHRHVERARRLVAHDEVRSHRERPRDRDALALAARELVRVSRHRLAAEPDLGEHLLDRLGLLALVLREPERRDPLGHDLAHRHARVQGRVRVLEDDLHAPAQRSERALGQPRDLLAVEEDASERRLDEPEHRASQRALAAPGFADEPQRLAGPDVKADARDRMHELRRAQKALPRREQRREFFHDDERFSRAPGAGPLRHVARP